MVVRDLLQNSGVKTKPLLDLYIFELEKKRIVNIFNTQINTKKWFYQLYLQRRNYSDKRHVTLCDLSEDELQIIKFTPGRFSFFDVEWKHPLQKVSPASCSLSRLPPNPTCSIPDILSVE